MPRSPHPPPHPVQREAQCERDRRDNPVPHPAARQGRMQAPERTGGDRFSRRTEPARARVKAGLRLMTPNSNHVADEWLA